MQSNVLFMKLVSLDTAWSRLVRLPTESLHSIRIQSGERLEGAIEVFCTQSPPLSPLFRDLPVCSPPASHLPTQLEHSWSQLTSLSGQYPLCFLPNSLISSYINHDQYDISYIPLIYPTTEGKVTLAICFSLKIILAQQSIIIPGHTHHYHSWQCVLNGLKSNEKLSIQLVSFPGRDNIIPSHISCIHTAFPRRHKLYGDRTVNDRNTMLRLWFGCNLSNPWKSVGNGRKWPVAIVFPLCIIARSPSVAFKAAGRGKRVLLKTMAGRTFDICRNFAPSRSWDHGRTSISTPANSVLTWDFSLWKGIW